MQDDDTSTRPRIRIHERALRKLWAYIEACPQEIGGLGLVECSADALLVTEIFLPHQDVTPSTTDPLTAGGIDVLMKALLARGICLSKLRFWWHSHADSPVYWSHEDRKTVFNLSSQDFCLSFVGNRRREHRLRLDASVPFRTTFDRLPFETVLETDRELAELVRKEVAEKVRMQKPSFISRVLGASPDESPVEDAFPLIDAADRRRFP